MTEFNLHDFDTPEQVFAHLAQLPPVERAGIELQLRYEALGEVCAPPEQFSPQQMERTRQLRAKYHRILPR